MPTDQLLALPNEGLNPLLLSVDNFFFKTKNTRGPKTGNKITPTRVRVL